MDSRSGMYIIRMGIVEVSIRRLKKQLDDWGGEYGDVAAAPAVFGSDQGAAS
jgi:hypothetical protein